MTRRQSASQRGFFAVGVYGCKTEANIGTLWRSATLYGAAFVFTVGARYRPQASDTPKTPRHTPLFHFSTLDDLIEHLPHGCRLAGVEMDERSTTLTRYVHPDQVAYLLGAEDHGLPRSVLDRCHELVQIETVRSESLNVAVAGSILLHDRHVFRKGRDFE